MLVFRPQVCRCCRGHRGRQAIAVGAVAAANDDPPTSSPSHHDYNRSPTGEKEDTSRVVGWHGAGLNSSNGGFNSRRASSSVAGGSGNEPLERMLERSLDIIVSNQESIMERLSVLEDAVEDVLEFGSGGATPPSSNEPAHAMRPGEGAVGAEKNSATAGVSRTHWWSKRVRHHRDRRRSSIVLERGTGGGASGGASDGGAGGGTDGGGAPLPHAVFDLPASS